MNMFYDLLEPVQKTEFHTETMLMPKDMFYDLLEPVQKTEFHTETMLMPKVDDCYKDAKYLFIVTCLSCFFSSVVPIANCPTLHQFANFYIIL